MEWSQEVLECRLANAKKEYYLPHVHQFALQGVVDVLEVVEMYKDSSISLDSWTVPRWHHFHHIPQLRRDLLDKNHYILQSYAHLGAYTEYHSRSLSITPHCPLSLHLTLIFLAPE